MATGNEMSYGDAKSLGQLTTLWQSPDFVRTLVSAGKSQVDSRGLVTNQALHDFYATYGTDVD